MIDSSRLLEDLTNQLTTLEEDLHQQVRELAEVRAQLQADYDAARRVGRTQDTFETWSAEPVTQAAVAWILGTVFVRFLEDNGLVEPGRQELARVTRGRCRTISTTSSCTRFIQSVTT